MLLPVLLRVLDSARAKGLCVNKFQKVFYLAVIVRFVQLERRSRYVSISYVCIYAERTCEREQSVLSLQWMVTTGVVTHYFRRGNGQ